VHGTFAHLALYCWHKLPGEGTLQHEASVTQHLLSKTHFLGQYLTVPHWQFFKSRLKTHPFHLAHNDTMTDVIWPHLPPPLNLRPYGGIVMCYYCYHYKSTGKFVQLFPQPINTLTTETLLHNSAVLHHVMLSVIKHEPLRLVCFDTQDTGHTDMLHYLLWPWPWPDDPHTWT